MSLVVPLYSLPCCSSKLLVSKVSLIAGTYGGVMLLLNAAHQSMSPNQLCFLLSRMPFAKFPYRLVTSTLSMFCNRLITSPEKPNGQLYSPFTMLLNSFPMSRSTNGQTSHIGERRATNSRPLFRILRNDNNDDQNSTLS